MPGASLYRRMRVRLEVARDNMTSCPKIVNLFKRRVQTAGGVLIWISLCNLCVLCVSVVEVVDGKHSPQRHRGGTEKKSKLRHYPSLPPTAWERFSDQ